MLKVLIIPIFFINVSLLYAQTVNIGVLAYNGKAQSIARWQPTADYLSNQIKGTNFKIVPLTHEGFDYSSNKKSIDFILTNPGHFVQLQVDNGIISIATFISHYEGQKLNQFSAVLVARNDGAVNELIDLKGKTLAAVNEDAFGGFQLAQNEFLDAGIDVKKDLDILWLGFPHVDLVTAVLDGKADVATVRSGVLEKMALRGDIDLNDIKILALKENKNFPFYRSFGMFPEWPFAKFPHTDLVLSKKVVKALLNMHSEDKAAIAANGAGWTIPFNYSSVHQILKRIQVSPYLPKEFSISDLWKVYQQWIITIILLFLLCVILLLRFYKANQQLKVVQQDLQKSRNYLEQAVIDRTNELNSINLNLKSEIEKHIATEVELNKGCDALQNIYLIFVREDLSRSQRLNSVVEALRFYLDFELIMLSSVHENGFKLCCVRPSSNNEKSPLSPDLAQQVIKQKNSFYSSVDTHWQEYLSCPIFLNGELSYLLELASSHSFEKVDLNQNTSKLSHNILYLIAHWIGYEALSVAVENEECQKHVEIKQRFETITNREKEVVRLLMQGESNKSMARLLNISVKTVEMHRANALRKTNAKSSTDIVQMAVLSGMFNEDK